MVSRGPTLRDECNEYASWLNFTAFFLVPFGRPGRRLTGVLGLLDLRGEEPVAGMDSALPPGQGD